MKMTLRPRLLLCIAFVSMLSTLPLRSSFVIQCGLGCDQTGGSDCVPAQCSTTPQFNSVDYDCGGGVTVSCPQCCIAE
jgi:hypothetical protein